MCVKTVTSYIKTIVTAPETWTFSFQQLLVIQNLTEEAKKIDILVLPLQTSVAVVRGIYHTTVDYRITEYNPARDIPPDPTTYP